MPVETMEENTAYRIFIPSLTKDKREIPHEKRMRAILKILNKCPGGNIIPSVGWYTSDIGEKILEQNFVIHINGKRPLSDNELEMLADELEQESIFHVELNNVNSQLYRGKRPIEDYTEFDDDEGRIYINFNNVSDKDCQGFIIAPDESAPKEYVDPFEYLFSQEHFEEMYERGKEFIASLPKEERDCLMHSYSEEELNAVMKS